MQKLNLKRPKLDLKVQKLDFPGFYLSELEWKLVQKNPGFATPNICPVTTYQENLNFLLRKKTNSDKNLYNLSRVFLNRFSLKSTQVKSRKIEFLDFQIEFLDFQIEFWPFQIEFWSFQIEFCPFQIEFFLFVCRFCSFFAQNMTFCPGKQDVLAVLSSQMTLKNRVLIV